MNIFKDKFYLIVSAIFLLSRLIIFQLEIKLFGISYGFHLLDKSLLQYDLLKSLFYLHSQPILWNLFIGTLTKIFNGNEYLINNIIEIYHLFLTLIILKVTILINKEIFNNKKIKIFLCLFIIFNPSILFWEKIVSYQHTVCTIIFLISYFVIKFVKDNENKFEYYVYTLLFILSLIWSLFQPLLILFIFIIFRFYGLKLNRNNIIFFIFILTLSFSPLIKNKIVFNSFTIGSWAGHNLSTTFLDWKIKCDLLNPNQLSSEEGLNDLRMYEKKYNRIFLHPSLVGEKSKYNNVGIIYRSQRCLKYSINRIIDNPKEYLNGRVMAFLASHGKFAFDFLYPKPIGWNKYYKHLDNIYSNPGYKFTRQILIFIYMMVVYIGFFYIVFFSNENVKLKKSIFVIIAIYFYITIIGHLATGHEHARMMYSGIVIHLLFLIYSLNKFFYEKKK